jgi:hypothetical protein
LVRAELKSLLGPAVEMTIRRVLAEHERFANG